MHERANLRDLAYNQMKLQYIAARTRGTERFLLPSERAEARGRAPDATSTDAAQRRVRSMSRDQLRRLRSYEEAHRHRRAVLRSFDRRLAGG
jgi:hypothetical protein